MSRESTDELAPDGSILNGFDYSLQVIERKGIMRSFIRWASGETWEWHPANNVAMAAHAVGHALEGDTPKLPTAVCKHCRGRRGHSDGYDTYEWRSCVPCRGTGRA